MCHQGTRLIPNLIAICLQGSLARKCRRKISHRRNGAISIRLDTSVRPGEHRQSRSLTDRESGVTRVSMVGTRIGTWNERDLETFVKKRARRNPTAG